MVTSSPYTFCTQPNLGSQFDKNGNTGGCQATYTVIPSATIDSTSCTNVTFPTGPLDVEAAVANGPMSQFGWIDQVNGLCLPS